MNFLIFLTTQKGLNLTKSVQGIRARHIFVSILSILLHNIFSVFPVFLSALIALPLFTGAGLLSMYLTDN